MLDETFRLFSDFLSELGLEKDDEHNDSPWDSEVHDTIKLDLITVTFDVSNQYSYTKMCIWASQLKVIKPSG